MRPAPHWPAAWRGRRCAVEDEWGNAGACSGFGHGRPRAPEKAILMNDDGHAARAARLVRAAHFEVYASTHLGESRIRIICYCEIGSDHTYSEWVERFGDGRYRGAGDPADTGALGSDDGGPRA